MVKDYFGKEILKGDHIVYPVRRANEMWMNSAIVTKITDNRIYITKYNGLKTYLKTGASDRVIVLEIR